MIVAYNLPDRDACGKLSGGTRISDAGYTAWVNQLASAIGARAAIVIVEPDGLPDIIRHCLSPAAATRRYKLLRYAMRKLGGLPHAQVYLDAGNPGMFANPGSLAGPLSGRASCPAAGSRRTCPTSSGPAWSSAGASRSSARSGTTCRR